MLRFILLSLQEHQNQKGRLKLFSFNISFPISCYRFFKFFNVTCRICIPKNSPDNPLKLSNHLEHKKNYLLHLRLLFDNENWMYEIEKYNLKPGKQQNLRKLISVYVNSFVDIIVTLRIKSIIVEKIEQ